MLGTRRAGSDRVLFILSGRIETTEDFAQIQEVIAGETLGQQLVLDLKVAEITSGQAINSYVRGAISDQCKVPDDH
jgi:hypothetical protein